MNLKVWLKTMGIALLALFLIVLCVGISKSREIYRLYKVVTLFDEGKIVENFRSMTDFFPFHEIKRAGPIFEFGKAPQPLPDSFVYKGAAYSVKKLLKITWTTGFIIIFPSRPNGITSISGGLVSSPQSMQYLIILMAQPTGPKVGYIGKNARFRHCSLISGLNEL